MARALGAGHWSEAVEPPTDYSQNYLPHTHIYPPKLTSLTTYAHETKAPEGAKPQTKPNVGKEH